MFRLRILRNNPHLTVPENWKVARGGGVVITRYDMISIIQRAHAECPEALADLEAEPATVPRYALEPLDHKKLICVRTGGAGDILMIAPSLMRIKQLYPSCHIAFATQRDFVALARMMPYIDSPLSLPIDAEEYASYDYYVDFYDTIEFPSREARTVAGVDIFAKQLLIDALPGDCRVAKLENTSGEIKRMRRCLAKEGVQEGDSVIVYQFSSSNPNRSFPIKKSMDLMGNLAFRPKTHIVIVGRQGDCMLQWRDRNTQQAVSSVHNWCGKTSIHELAALIEISDLCISPDSATIHLAGSFEKPCIGLFNVVPPELRVADYVNHYALMTKYECSPCFCHGSNHCSKHAILIDRMKDKAPEQLLNGAPCWDSISVQEVLALVDRLLGEKGKDHAV